MVKAHQSDKLKSPSQYDESLSNSQSLRTTLYWNPKLSVQSLIAPSYLRPTAYELCTLLFFFFFLISFVLCTHLRERGERERETQESEFILWKLNLYRQRGMFNSQNNHTETRFEKDIGNFERYGVCKNALISSSLLLIVKMWCKMNGK